MQVRQNTGMKASEKRSDTHLQKLRKEMKFAAAGSIIIWPHNKNAVPKNTVLERAILP